MEKFPGNIDDVYDRAFPDGRKDSFDEAGGAGQTEREPESLSEKIEDAQEQVVEISESRAIELAKEEFGWLEGELSPASFEKLIAQQAQKLQELDKLSVRNAD